MTPDKAVWKGHYYSDKAPGTAALAAPVFASSVALARALHIDLESPAGWLMCSWLSCAFSLAPLTALGGVACCRWLAAKTGYIPALIATLAVFLGAAPYPYATMMFSHAFVAGLVSIALWAVDFDYGLRPGRWRLELLAGFALGYAAASEFTAGLVVAGVGLYWLKVRGWRAAALGCLAAIPPLLLIPLYSYLCFGTPFTIGYAHQATFEQMKHGLFGIQWPNLSVAFNLLFPPSRGLLSWTPFMLLVPLGFPRLRREYPAAFWLCLLAPLIHLVVISGEAWDWPAGWVLGPRYLAPCLPLLALPAAIAARRNPILGACLAALSIFLTGLATLIDATPREERYVPNPLLDLHLPALRHGEFGHSFGQLFGLSGSVSASVLLVAAVAAIIWLAQMASALQSEGDAQAVAQFSAVAGHFEKWLSDRRLQFSVAAGLILISVVATRWDDLAALQLDYDEGNRMSIAHALNHGRTLYLDAWDHHTFLDILFFQQVFRVFSPEQAPIVLHVVNLAVVAGISGLVFWVALRLSASFAAGHFATWAALFIFSRPLLRSSHGELYHSLTSLAALAVYLLVPRTRLSLAAIGALLAAGFCVKQTALFDMGAFLLIHLIMLRRPDRFTAASARESLWIILGGAAVFAASAGYFIWHRSAKEALFAAVPDALQYATGTGMADTLRRYGQAARYELGCLLGLHWLITVSLVLSAFCLLHQLRRRQDTLFSCAGAIWTACILAGIISIGRFYNHYFIQLAAPLGLFCAGWVAALRPQFRAIAVLAGFVLLYLRPMIAPEPVSFAVDPANDTGAVRSVALYLRDNTAPKDTIFIYHNSALCLYFLSERFPPTKNFMCAQLLPENKDGMALLEDGLRRWKEAPPKYIVTGAMPWRISQIEAIVAGEYHMTNQIGPFAIYQRTFPPPQ